MNDQLNQFEEFSPYKIKPSEYQDVLDKYNGGNDVKSLAEEYGVNLQTIYRILKKCEIKPTGAGRPKRFDEKKENEIVAKYESGISSVKIAKEYDVSATTILNIIKSKGVDVRKSGPQNGKEANHYKFKRKISKSDHETIAEKYKQGSSTPKLAKEFNVSRERICKILDSMNVERRSKQLGQEEVKTILGLYEIGHSVRVISQKTNRSQSTIVSLLTSKGIKIERGRGVRKVKKEDYAELVKRYQRGDKLKDIANTYGVQAPTVGQILKSLGIKKDRMPQIET